VLAAPGALNRDQVNVMTSPALPDRQRLYHPKQPANRAEGQDMHDRQPIGGEVRLASI
jgi:hypothetical protein